MYSTRNVPSPLLTTLEGMYEPRGAEEQMHHLCKQTSEFYRWTTIIFRVIHSHINITENSCCKLCIANSCWNLSNLCIVNWSIRWVLLIKQEPTAWLALAPLCVYWMPLKSAGVAFCWHCVQIQSSIQYTNVQSTNLTSDLIPAILHQTVLSQD